MVNEAAHCLGEQILRSARDGDIGAIFGLGWPPFRGGPFRYADSVGAEHLAQRLASYQDRFGVRFTPAPMLGQLARSGGKFFQDR
jgi:3-hydroxyacyl-CoA dehydrogenase/enoyl-CoA hydratase/3-hydroxybutyryl-CoA epimerase